MNIELDGADGQKVRPIISGFDISAKAGELIEVKLHTWLNEGNIAAAISQDRIRESFDELLAAVGLKCVPMEDEE